MALRLEWPTLRDGRIAASFSHREAGALVGFLGLYAFGDPADVELVGMVDPDHRRRGVATALLDAALEWCEREGRSRRLLLVPRTR